jgi:hypothetical protein
MKLALAIVIGAIVALVVYFVGIEIVNHHREGLIVGLIALLVWLLVTLAVYREDRIRL